MAERVSALAEHYEAGRFGADGDIGVTLSDCQDLVLHQVAAWPDTIEAVGETAAAAVGAASAPGPGRAVAGEQGALLRIEPLKWWVYGIAVPELDAEQGVTLDLSHSRTHVRIDGPQAAVLINRNLPVDLRERAFPVGSVASSVFHHVGVTLWRSEHGYELFLPRGFALSLWEVLMEGAAQFGAQVR